MSYYDKIARMVESLQEKDVPIERVIVPSKKFSEVKEHAEVEGSGFSQDTLVNGVKVTHLQHRDNPSVRIDLEEYDD